MESLQAEQSRQGGLLEGLAAKLISRTDLIVTKQDQLHCAVVGDTITPPMTSPQAESKLTLSDYDGPQPPSRVSIGKPEQCSYGSSYQSDSLQYNFNIVFQDLGLADLFPEEVANTCWYRTPYLSWIWVGHHQAVTHVTTLCLLVVLNHQALLLVLCRSPPASISSHHTLNHQSCRLLARLHLLQNHLLFPF